jgi:hypothetical protein
MVMRMATIMPRIIDISLYVNVNFDFTAY